MTYYECRGRNSDLNVSFLQIQTGMANFSTIAVKLTVKGCCCANVTNAKSPVVSKTLLTFPIEHNFNL